MATTTAASSTADSIGIDLLPRSKKTQIAYTLTLLDPAYIRSNSPDEIMVRQIGSGERFIIPASKVRHGMREFLETIERSIGIGEVCRAQNYCSACPACFVFGTLGSVGENRKNWSFTSRVEMCELIALKEGADAEMRTINSVDPLTMKTEKSLNRSFAVPAGTEFYGMITVSSTHEDLVTLVLGGLLGVTRVGARTSNNGLCEVKILGVRESFKENPAWAPQRVIEGGLLPTGKAASMVSLDVEGEEDRLIETVQRFDTGVVQEVIRRMSAKINEIAKPGKALLEILNKAQGGVADLKAFGSSIKQVMKAAEGQEDLVASLADIRDAMADAAKNLKTAPEQCKAILAIADTLRGNLIDLGVEGV